MAYHILKMFDPNAIYLINGTDIDRPRNALTLTRDIHTLFGSFEIAFEPVGPRPHTYKVDYVDPEFLSRVADLPVIVTFHIMPDRSIDPPSPQLLNIHRAIGRILHLSAAGEYIDIFLRDMDEIKEGEVATDGSTRVDDYVWLKLRELTSIRTC